MRLRQIIENDLSSAGMDDSADSIIDKKFELNKPQLGQEKPLSQLDISQQAMEMSGDEHPDAIEDTLEHDEQQRQLERQQQLRDTEPKFNQFQQGLHDLTADVIRNKATNQANTVQYDTMGSNLSGLETLLKDLQGTMRR